MQQSAAGRGVKACRDVSQVRLTDEDRLACTATGAKCLLQSGYICFRWLMGEPTSSTRPYLG